MLEELQGTATEKLIGQIRTSVIGEGKLFGTPFGQKPLIYSDYTASGRALSFLEDYIRDQVLPFYANTHSEASATGRQSTAFREQSRALIRKSINASDEDAIIFCGSGATAAIQKIVDILNIRIPANMDDRHGFSHQIAPEDRPVVFVGPYEHHSNELAWRESTVDVVAIPLSKNGDIDQAVLAQELERYAGRRLIIGSFSAASNVTGLLSDVAGLTRLLHDHGALAFWDYAAAGPYVEIDVTGAQDEKGDSSLDAIFISPHKFIGGPGTPGVLVIKRRLLTNRVPSVPGGGTVSYVSPEGHQYHKSGEAREEGGTPAIVESIRAGMVFQLKDAVGPKNIEALEHDMITRAIARWSRHPNIQILGDLKAPRTSILSFLILWQGKPLHFGFVDALINDLFGIQVRGGCSCAGPYGHELLHIDRNHSRAITDAVEAGHNALKPGWVRLNFNYFIGEETFEYLLRAVELIADHGWKLMPHYAYDKKRSLWVCQRQSATCCADLNDISFTGGLFSAPHCCDLGAREALSHYIDVAEKLLQEEGRDLEGFKTARPMAPLPQGYAELRWFGLPEDWDENWQRDDDPSALKTEKPGLWTSVTNWLSSGLRSTG
ncbi:aminotransferase class V-fold PLP-dependent enzyme [Paremcibacter congregatus]|uniref:aminotransferase class V-fold PLP-dependent enzyme n=1 Tax=Paremcibacter congregatus TaxID=2043170 RepID=UPI0030ECEA9B